MQLRSDIQLRSIIKALSDVVRPAIDPANGPAAEQLHIAIGLLTLMEERLPLQFAFDCDELQRLGSFATDLRALAHEQTGDAIGEVNGAAAAGADVLARAKADPAEVLAAVRRLRSACSEATTALRQITGVNQDALRDCVLAYSREQLLRDRSWLKSQGWESDPDAVPDIKTLIAIPDHAI